MTKSKPASCRTTNWFDYNVGFRKRGSLLIWLDREMIPEGEEIEHPTPEGAYNTDRCHTAIIERQSVAIIPIRQNGRKWKKDRPAV